MMTHSLPLSTYSAPGGLRQGPRRAAESPAEAGICGNGESRSAGAVCRRGDRAGTSNRRRDRRWGCGDSARRCGCAPRRTRSSWRCRLGSTCRRCRSARRCARWRPA
ncbi:hypothetical protein BOG92_045555 [Streptomyces sp. WAC00263]|nr:hypothetical protein BOG92_045555 [Streptomyces sp. WAC00263]